jgi:hypothetical protein
MTDTLREEIQTIIAAGRPRQGRPPGGVGIITRPQLYHCDTCGRETDRTQLFTRQVSFVNVATKKRERTRNVDWVCRECMETHPEYARVKTLDAPGMTEAHRAKG